MSEQARCAACGATRDMGCPEVGDWTYCRWPTEPGGSRGNLDVHASDCAVHNEPALPAGPCDCAAA